MSNPSFQRRHYEAIAGIIDLDFSQEPNRDYIAEKFADMLAADSPRFDRARFLKACGVA